MRVALRSDAVAFPERAAPLLLADEARHNLILGLAGVIRDAPDVYRERRFWCVVDPRRRRRRGAPDAAAQPRRAAGGGGGARAARRGARGGAPGRGRGEAGDRRGRAPLVEAPPPRRPRRARAGRVRARARRARAGAGRAARGDAGGPRAPRRVVERVRPRGAAAAPVRGGADGPAIDHRLRSEHAGILLWEDGGDAVSLAGYGGWTPSGIRVGPVYTPPELRGRGYATALVAELSQRLLAGGRRSASSTRT